MNKTIKIFYPITFIFYLLSFILYLTSCQRQPDTLNPKITILLPSQNEIFSIPAEISYDAIVEDDQNIESVEVYLTQDQVKPLSTPKFYYPGNKYFELSGKIFVEDIHLESGTYYIMFRAYDGNNYKNEFAKIILNGVNRKLEGFVVITEKGDHVNVHKIPLNPGIPELMTIQSDYVGSGVNSKHQQLYFLGANQINFDCYDLTLDELIWSENQVMEVPFHYQRSLFFEKEEIYVSYNQGFIRGYDQNGGIFFATEYTQLTEPATLFKQDDLIIAELKEKSGHKRFITTYYAVSGMQKYQFESNFEVVAFLELDQNLVYVLANEDEGSNIYTYNLATNKLVHLHPFYFEEILSAVSIDKNNIIIGSALGAYWYRYDVNSLTSYVESLSANTLDYEDIGNFVLIADEKEFELFTFPGGVPMGGIEMDEKILNVHLLHNK